MTLKTSQPPTPYLTPSHKVDVFKQKTQKLKSQNIRYRKYHDFDRAFDGIDKLHCVQLFV